MQHRSTKSPRPVSDTVFAFPPNRDTMGGTSYFILENSGNILVDCPAWDAENQEFLQEKGGIRWLFLTHRGAIGRVKEIQAAFGCEVLIQEQEAYLLPGLAVTSFQFEFILSPSSQAIWTPGHTPGSACLYHREQGGILFTGRHLLPNQQGEPVPLRIAKTFHWRRQLESIGKLRDRFSAETLQSICPGANTGFLRGQRKVDRAYEQLMQLDLEALREMKPGL
ncbi:MBL fold metallo-hydrolase [Egbenema bharatensis]|uniref:MBL fold metallo-hydrolase n=1 Tax=Egbenema bharatensis TaxID=3463334 RepID=UPI003A8B7BC7